MKLAIMLGAGLVATACMGTAANAENHTEPADLARQALDALGVQTAIAGGDWITADIAGEAWMLEQSGTLEGGWIRLDQTAQVTADLASRHGEVSEARSVPAWNGTPYGSYTIRFADDATASARNPRAEDDATAWGPARMAQARQALRYLDVFPAALLRQALFADDLRHDGENRLAFTRSVFGIAEQVTIDIQPGSGIPTGFTVETSFPHDMFLSGWGESTVRGTWGFWWRTESGRLRPRQLEVTFNGRPWQRFELSSFSTDRPALAGTLAQPPETAPGGFAIDDFPFSRRHESPAENVRVYYGAWNVMAVALDDGVYILDAPISPGYARAVMDQVETDFPGQPVRGVITTSNAWPHMAGLAAYAERGIPVHVHPDNIDLVTAMVPALRGSDTLVPVFNGQEIGTGENRLRIRLATGPALDRMAFVLVPGANLVWGSDAVQLDRGTQAPSPHARQYIAEFLDAVCADVQGTTQVVAMHIDPVSIDALNTGFAGDPAAQCQEN